MDTTSTILIVEDNPDDYKACVTALTEDRGLRNPIHWCRKGSDALEYLTRTGVYADAEVDRPGLVLLDLNLPGIKGEKVLTQIKEDPALKTIPVIVMTSSRDPADIEACYTAGANSYVTKPVDLEGFMEAIARLRDFWFKIVVLPEAT